MVESLWRKRRFASPNWLWVIRQVLLNIEPLDVPARIEERSPDAALFRLIRRGKGYEEAYLALQVVHLTEAAYINLRI
tara:strand:- start:1700 stop:1933 length:234 start_codon:yes stop_codon:yes gene_type:complete